MVKGLSARYRIAAITPAGYCTFSNDALCIDQYRTDLFYLDSYSFDSFSSSFALGGAAPDRTEVEGAAGPEAPGAGDPLANLASRALSAKALVVSTVRRVL